MKVQLLLPASFRLLLLVAGYERAAALGGKSAALRLKALAARQ